MYPSHQISRRIAGLATLLVILVLGVSVFSAVNVRSLGTETRRIAQRDLPLALTISEIEITQLQQSVLFERAVRYGLAMQHSSAFARPFSATTEDFVGLSERAGKLFALGTEIMGETDNQSSFAGTEAEFERILTRLEAASAAHSSFEKTSKGLFHQLEGYVAVSELTIGELAAEEDRLNRVLHQLEEQVNGLTSAALNNAAKNERSTLLAISVVGGISIFVGIIASTLMVRSSLSQAQAESSLRESEAALRAMVDGAADGVVSINEAGLIENFNRTAERIFGRGAEEVIGRNVSVLMPEPDRSAHDTYLAHYLSTGVKRIIGIGREVTGMRKDGTTFPLDLAIGEAQLDSGRRFTATLRDLSERKELEERLQEARKLESLGRLAGGIAHDFNNLLLPIIAITTVTRQDLADDLRLTRNLDKVLDAANLGKALVDKIMAFGLRQNVERRPTDLGSVIRKSVDLARVTLPEKVSLEAEIDDTVGPSNANSTQIHQVVANLLSNAVDAIGLEAGTVQIKLGRHAGSKGTSLNTEYAVVTVRDTGRGMDQEIQDRIFEPFFTTKTSGAGNGLGLAAVHGIVNDHEGYIAVSSDPGCGTTLKVYLPIIDARSVQEDQGSVRS